jgi:hypothetical protein
MTPVTMRAAEDPERSWRVRHRHQPDFAEPLSMIGPVVDAHACLADVAGIEPLTVHVELAYVDLIQGFHDGMPALPRWCLEVDGPAAVEADWQPAATRLTVPAIDRAALVEFLRRASAQPTEPGVSVCPVAIWLRSVRVRLPAPWSRGPDHLKVAFGGGTIEVNVDRDQHGAWVREPIDSLLRSPIRTYGRVEGGLTDLTIDAYWSPWYEQGEAGTEAIARAVDTLSGRGWELER